jgi:hypothetical protein
MTTRVLSMLTRFSKRALIESKPFERHVMRWVVSTFDPCARRWTFTRKAIEAHAPKNFAEDLARSTRTAVIFSATLVCMSHVRAPVKIHEKPISGKSIKPKFIQAITEYLYVIEK